MTTITSDEYISTSEVADYLHCRRAWWLWLSGCQRQKPPLKPKAPLPQFAGNPDEARRSRRKRLNLMLLVWWVFFMLMLRAFGSRIAVFNLLTIPLIILMAIVLYRIATQPDRPRSQNAPPGEYVWRGRRLVSDALRLTGTPDWIVERNGAAIPVLVEQAELPDKPDPEDALVMAAYCHLVEQSYRLRPPYGIFRYGDRESRCAYTAALEAALVRQLDEMRTMEQRGEVHRSHDWKWRCEECGFRGDCSERLDTPA